MMDVPIPEPLPGFDAWKLQAPDDAEAERERAVRMSYEDRADELYQKWKEGDL